MKKKIGILGFSREGRATYAFLVQHGAPPGDISILDKNPQTNIPRGAHAVLGKDYLARLKEFGVIYRTPGIPYLLPQIQSAKRSGVKISSATKLFFENCRATIVGITGTKGKSTTSTLLYRMLKAARRDVYLAGNIGAPALTLLPRIKKSSIVVLELSSFQLQDLDKSPQIAAVLDVFPDHQNSHGSIREYYGAKANIARFQKKSGSVFYFSENPVSRHIARLSPGKRIPIQKDRASFAADELAIKGVHSARNVATAAAVASRLGVPRRIIRKAALSFKGLPHRIEFVREIKTKNGAITFWNDSASSNPGAAAAAARAFRGEAFILIAGGKDKNLDYRPLAAALRASPARLVVLYGENKRKIAGAIKATSTIRFVSNLRGALRSAYAAAKKITPGRTSAAVVLSPGSASFDMFKNFEDRGETFKKLVRNL